MPSSRKSERPSDHRRHTPGSHRDSRTRKYLLIAFAAAVVLGAIGLAGWSIDKGVRTKSALKSARAFAAQKDYENGAIAAKRAFDLNPTDLEANKLIAEMLEGLGTKEAVVWRRNVADLQPGVTENYLAWANRALEFKDLAGAGEALKKIDASGKNTAAYHDAAARLALAEGRSSDVQEHVAEAARLDPDNASYQMQLAAVQLGSPLPEVRKAATAAMEQLAAKPELQRQALRTLIQAALARGDGSEAIKLTTRLVAQAGNIFEDRLLLLNLLGQTRRIEYWWCLAQFRAALPTDDTQLVTLLSWMNNHGLSRLSLTWAQDLPDLRRNRLPVSVAVAEAYALSGNWSELKTLLKMEKWGDLEFQRLALNARVAREAGDDATAQSNWSAAVTQAGDRREARTALLRFAQVWKWEAEYTELLWVIARGRTNQEAALGQLLTKYLKERRTTELLSVFRRVLEIDPQSAPNKNNVAYASLLLNDEPEKAEILAREANLAEPRNGSYAATYALALHLKQKTDEGLKIMRAANPADLQTPSTALAYAVLLTAKGENEEARKYLAIAETGNLLPQEQTLLSKTRGKVSPQP